MTIKAFTEAPLPRPVPVVPVAKPRGTGGGGKTAMSAASSAPHYANYVNYDRSSGAIPKKGTSEAESSDSTASMLNEAADAVAKYFAKLTQGINKGNFYHYYIELLFR